MKRVVKSNTAVLGMSNVRGKFVKTDNIDFSFYFSSSDGVSHWSRVKIRFNREKISHTDFDGYMELHSDFKWEPNRRVKASEVNKAREFFKKYSVLFNAVWKEQLYEVILEDYLRGIKSFKEMLAEFEVDESLYETIQNCETLEDLEEVLN